MLDLAVMLERLSAGKTMNHEGSIREENPGGWISC